MPFRVVRPEEVPLARRNKASRVLSSEEYKMVMAKLQEGLGPYEVGLVEFLPKFFDQNGKSADRVLKNKLVQEFKRVHLHYDLRLFKGDGGVKYLEISGAPASGKPKQIETKPSKKR